MFHVMRTALSALLLGLVLAPPVAVADAGAAAAATLEADYVVRWSGMEIGRFDTALRRRGNDYHLSYQARTSGPLRWVVDFSSAGWAAGRIDAEGVVPRHFRGQSRWRDGGGFWRVSFAADGRVTELALDDATRADREPVPDELQRGPDPLSLMLAAVQDAGAGERLAASSFDGRRAMRYDLACAQERSVVQPVALGGAPRDALLCEVDGALVAGRSQRWSDRAEVRAQDRSPVRIWLVAEVGGLAHWPVRLEADSRYGTVTVELAALVEPAS